MEEFTYRHRTCNRTYDCDILIQSNIHLRVHVPPVKKQCCTPLTHEKMNLNKETDDGEVEAERKPGEQ
jgi:hypothetical protein